MRILFIAAVVCSCGKAEKAKQLDWHRAPQHIVEASAGGQHFEISMPEDWEARKPPDEGWGPTTGDAFKRPYVTVQNVSVDLASSLETALSTAGAKPENVIRKDKKGDDYVITEAKEATLIRATTFRRAGNTFLWCTAAQANDDGIPVFTETRQTLQKICDSIVVK